ncbi:hypothetical protein V2E24_00630 [Mycoplasmopsis ciconiae]|uniref:NERD domain-containing protein n=1 Tax=Mycoplasmopsis ciconiae TaxID=561067 RepID=A0ABU7MKM4_9BACT|nr:hypothetical protein [Mycoplasmopsis ciconiae]
MNKDSQLSFKYNLFEPTTLNIAVWVTAIILIITLVVVIIWRLKFDKTPKYNLKEVGSINKELNQFAMSLSASGDFKIIYNIYFANKYAKNDYSILPMLIINNKNQIYLVSNMILNKPNQEIVVDRSSFLVELRQQNKKTQYFDKARLYWYNDIYKYIKKELISDTKVDFCKILLYKNPGAQIKNNTDFEIVNINDLSDFINNDSNSYCLSDMQIKNIINRFNSINLHKNKVKKLD